MNMERSKTYAEPLYLTWKLRKSHFTVFSNILIPRSGYPYFSSFCTDTETLDLYRDPPRGPSCAVTKTASISVLPRPQYTVTPSVPDGKFWALRNLVLNNILIRKKNSNMLEWRQKYIWFKKVIHINFSQYEYRAHTQINTTVQMKDTRKWYFDCWT